MSKSDWAFIDEVFFQRPVFNSDIAPPPYEEAPPFQRQPPFNPAVPSCPVHVQEIKNEELASIRLIMHYYIGDEAHIVHLKAYNKITVYDLKCMIEYETSIPKESQILLHRGDPLFDKYTLRECDLYDCSHLLMEIKELNQEKNKKK